MRIRLETDAFYLIMQHIQNGRYTMIVRGIAGNLGTCGNDQVSVLACEAKNGFRKRHREWQSQLEKEPFLNEVFGTQHR